MLKQENYETLQIERRENGVAVVTLNRPEKLNAINGKMHAELATFSRDFANDRDLRVLVLTGAGRAFSAGGDFSPDSRIGSNREGPPMMVEARQIVDHLLECEKPLIAAVNGYAMGLGANVALLCDVVVAGPSAVFADTHVNMGIGAGDGGQLIWPFLIGVNKAKYFLMTGDRLTGKEAEDGASAGLPTGVGRNGGFMVEILATACAGIFAGAALFISLVQQPAALEVGANTSAKLFPPM